MTVSFSPWPFDSRGVRRLQEALPPALWSLLQCVARQAEKYHWPLYLVGGFVRDVLLGRPSTDFDLVVEGNAITLARALKSRYGGRVTTHTAFGTAQWHLAGSQFETCCGFVEHLDLVSARLETYAYPGALPTVSFGSLADDLRRRDFTINAMAIRLDGDLMGELRDDLGGLDDLKDGLVRALHPRSYFDDPTRILRAVRYEQRYGFRIEASDLALFAEAKGILSTISGERLRHELDLILEEEKAAAMLARLEELGILSEIHPSLRWETHLSAFFGRLAKSEPEAWKDVPNLRPYSRRAALAYLLWLGRLAPTEIRSLAARLDFPASLRQALLALPALHSDLPSLSQAKPSLITARLEQVPLLAVCALSLEYPSFSYLNHYLASWRHISPYSTGETLQALGLPPGPTYSAILSRLRAAWLDGEVANLEQETALLHHLINEFSHPDGV